MQVIVGALLVGIFMLLISEISESILLARERDNLNSWATLLEDNGLSHLDVSKLRSPEGHVALHVRWDVGRNEAAETNIRQLLFTSLTRPFGMLCAEPIATYLSLWTAFSWSVLYITLAVILLMFTDVYGFSLSQADFVIAAACVGSIVAIIVSIHQERFLEHRRPPSSSGKPERRLYLTCVECLLPVRLFLFGWTVRVDIHWITPTIAISLATCGIFSVYLPVFNYKTDCYQAFVSSALAAQSACRNIMGGVFPLITTQLYKRLGWIMVSKRTNQPFCDTPPK